MSTELNSTNQQPVQLPFTTSHAFLIGINAYEHLTPLSTAVNDATVIAERLANQHGFQVHPPLLDADHKRIRKLLTVDIPKLVGEDDRVLFYFAGHGIALDSEAGPNGYLVAADTQAGKDDTLIPMQMLHDALTGLPCRHGLLILDCCFSGAFKWSSGFRDVLFDLPKVIYEERFWRYCKDPAWQVITSAAHDQKAVDILTNQSLGLRETNGGAHSPFAESLLRALDGEGDTIPAGEGDGVMTATEIYSYLRDEVESSTTEHTKRQSPSIFNLQRHDKGEFIFLNPRHRFNLPPTPDRNPFMGLSSYDEDDSSLFYGRDRVVEALLNKVESNPLIVVSGASGTGKSSVIKAGVLPKLRDQQYNILPIIRPGQEPMRTLATDILDIDEQLKKGPCVLVIDQYEELITQCLHPEERTTFEQQISKWLRLHSQLRVLISVRADFEPQFESEALAHWWSTGRYVVPSFSLDEIREVITKPAAQAVLFYEPADLVEQLSEEVSQAPGALPLLSFTLSELYHAYLQSGRQDRSLSLEDYEKLGGVIGALRTRADAEYKALAPAEQSSMRKLMLRMVSLEGGELAGKRVYAEELKFSNSAESTRLRVIAEKLVGARLLLQGTDGQGRAYIEPAHDALVRAWARLWEWIKTVGEEKITLQYKLSQAVNDYHQLSKTDEKKARNLLWNNNPRLDLLKAELAGNEHGLNAQEETFVRDSIKRRSARQRNGWIIAIAVIVGLAGSTVYAFNQRNSALAQQEIAEQKTIEVQDSAKVAARQRLRANQEASRAISNSLASQSALRRSNDPTVAFRLAQASLEYDSTSIQAKGALLAAFFANIVNNNAGVFYREVEDAPHLVPFDSPVKQLRRAGDQFPPHRVGEYRRNIVLQSWYSPQGRFFMEFNSEHSSANVLDMIDIQEQRRDERVYIYTDVRFSSESFHPNDEQLIIPDANAIEFFSPPDINNPLSQLSAPTAVQQAVFAEQGRKVYAKTFDGRILEWPLNAYPIPTFGKDIGYLRYFYLSPDGKTMILLGGEIRVYQYERGKWQLESDQANQSAYEIFQHTLLQREGYPDLNLSPFTFRKEKSYLELDYEVDLPDPGKYQLKMPESKRSVHIEELVGNKRSIELAGHVFPIVSVSVSPDGSSILTSSAREVKLWDWLGNNYLSIDHGGSSGYMPDGKSFFLFNSVFSTGADPSVLYSQMQLFPIDIDAIQRWASEHDIYELSDAERLKYGLDH